MRAQECLKRRHGKRENRRSKRIRLRVNRTPFPPRGSAIASPSENLIETRFALDRERPRRTGRDAGSTGRHRPGTSSSRLPVGGDMVILHFGLFDSGLVDGAIEIFELCAFQICFEHQKILT